MATTDEVKLIIGDVLQLGSRIEGFEGSTALLGSLPEFDSMAVVSVLTALEDHFGIIVEDDEISAETFESLGSLQNFVIGKIEA